MTSATSRGFTLIEILVVLLIIGITLSMALLAFGDFGKQRRIVIAGEHFNAYIKLVQQQAILDGSTLGIHIDNKGYQVLQLSATTKWRPIPLNPIYRIQHFPEGLSIWFKNKHYIPEIIINSSGDMTPFTLSFGMNDQTYLTLIGAQNGAITQLRGKSP